MFKVTERGEHLRRSGSEWTQQPGAVHKRSTLNQEVWTEMRRTIFPTSSALPGSTEHEDAAELELDECEMPLM
jgi:hypothetical protein